MIDNYLLLELKALKDYIGYVCKMRQSHTHTHTHTHTNKHKYVTKRDIEGGGYCTG